MAVSTKIIKGRIRSIKSTKKITKAMELVSGAKMRKAVDQTLASRAYATEAWDILRRLAARKNQEITHPLLAVREPTKRAVVVVVSANRGLCGSFNTQIAANALAHKGAAPVVEFITLGKKARDSIRRAGGTIIADFPKPDVVTSAAEVSALARMVNDLYRTEAVDAVLLVYTHFASSLRQVTTVKTLLPASLEEQRPTTGSDALRGRSPDPSGQDWKTGREYFYEPSPAIVLNSLLPRLVELQIYQAVLESDASEHSARMLAMRNATDAAGEMIDELTLSFNQARQAGITREIAEISGGKAALE